MLRKWGMPHHFYWLSAAGDLNSCWCYTWWWFLLTMMTRPEQLYLDTTCWLSTSSRVVAVSVCWCGITQVLRLTPPSSSSGLYPRLNIEPPPSSTAESGDPNSSLLLLRSNQQQSIFHTRPKLTLKTPQKTRPWKVSFNPLAGPSGGLSCPIIFSYFRTRWDPAFPQCMFNLFFFLMVWPSFGRISTPYCWLIVEASAEEPVPSLWVVSGSKSIFVLLSALFGNSNLRKFLNIEPTTL